MTFDSLNLPLIISNNFNANKKDIQGGDIVISPRTQAKLPDPIQPSILYMEASLPPMSMSKTDSSLNLKLRRLLPPPFSSERHDTFSSSPINFTIDDEEEQQGEEDSIKQPSVYEVLEIPFTQHLENSSASSATSSTCSSNNSNKSNNKQYICSLCQKKFMRPSSLKIHIYSHTGEKPFNCSFPGCRRKFSVQSNMRRHLRVHSN